MWVGVILMLFIFSLKFKLFLITWEGLGQAAVRMFLQKSDNSETGESMQETITLMGWFGL